MKKQDTIIVDLDGTLANVEHRKKYFKRDKKGVPNWNVIMKHAKKDTSNDGVVDIVSGCILNHHGYHNGRDLVVIICTTRPQDYERETWDWLSDNVGFYIGDLHMAKSGEKRPDTVVKKEMLKKIKKNYNVIMAIDDRLEVCKMYREEGIFTLDVGGNE
jgi:hypothetical protein